MAKNNNEQVGNTMPIAELQKWQDSLSKREKGLNEKELELEQKQLEAQNNFPKLFEEQFAPFKKQLEQREAQLVSELALLEAEKEKLRQRERTIQKAEIQRDRDYTDDGKKFDEELNAKRSRQDEELAERRQKAFNQLEKSLSEEKRIRLQTLNEELATIRTQEETSMDKKRRELEALREALTKRKAELDDLKDDLDYQKQRLQSGKDALEGREANLNDEVETKVEARKKSFDKEKAQLKEEAERLRDDLKTSNELVSSFEELKRKLGDEDPAAVLLKLKTYEEEIKNLREELATRPTQEMQQEFDRLKSENNRLEDACSWLSDENVGLKKDAREQSELKLEIDGLQAENKSYKQRFESVDADNNRLTKELKRLQASYEREQDREARIRDIETPYIEKELPRAAGEVAELDWLDRISDACMDYGLKFPKRILYAFHTALKTAEWSPITVLAGVSGTGKSELPRLYSHFGGINFLSLSVQPNWDSQESMLGFFNSIDNKFDAQPVLRLLAQSQKEKSDDYQYGLEDAMTLILMDEMNLAYVELYFAEFLSKLELRRGRKGKEVPKLEVKLGAGIPHYDLPLGRNVLWTGTMNQDETTKSLSDKVLDRGIIINFPRPITLERRRQLKPLPEQAPLLSRKLWESWWCKKSEFDNDQIRPFKGFIEDMNKSLAEVGRALGHRVWQSIEYYMANYPDVLQAQKEKDDAALTKKMKVAFEDQLVQKVMPKLRGIETRGKAKSDCLDKIKEQLANDDYAIVGDFERACEFGYGQFIWNSAEYLKDDEPEADNDDQPANDPENTEN